MSVLEPRDLIEVITPHGLGVVLYIELQGVHTNDVWTIATKSDGQIRHYQTCQVKLAYNGTWDLNRQSEHCPMASQDDFNHLNSLIAKTFPANPV